MLKRDSVILHRSVALMCRVGVDLHEWSTLAICFRPDVVREPRS